MATPTLALNLDKTSYNVGDKITATYVLTGADDVPATSVSVSPTGSVTLDGASIQATIQGPVTVTTPAVTHTRTFAAPVVNGVTLAATAVPTVWTGTAA